MTQIARGIDRRTFITGAAALGVVALLRPEVAFAEPTSADKMAEAEAVRARILVMQDELEVASDRYYQALDEHNAAVRAVADAQARIDEANAKIADLQERLGQRARSMYRTDRSTAIDFILGATTFEEFATNWDLLKNINEQDAAMVQETKDLRAEVEAAKIELENQERIAAEKEDEAARIKQEVEESIVSLEATVQQLDAEAQALLEQEQEAERAAAAAAAAARTTYAYSSGSVASIPSQGSVVDYALSRIGCPYVWAAEGPDAFDCSGLVTWAYAQVGIYVPHQTEAQYHAAAARIPVSEAQPGDVLWVSYGDGYNGHVGIACNAGGTHYVHAPTFGAFVRDTDPLSWAGFTHALRFV